MECPHTSAPIYPAARQWMNPYLSHRRASQGCWCVCAEDKDSESDMRRVPSCYAAHAGHFGGKGRWVYIFSPGTPDGLHVLSTVTHQVRDGQGVVETELVFWAVGSRGGRLDYCLSRRGHACTRGKRHRLESHGMESSLYRVREGAMCGTSWAQEQKGRGDCRLPPPAVSGAQ